MSTLFRVMLLWHVNDQPKAVGLRSRLQPARHALHLVPFYLFLAIYEC